MYAMSVANAMNSSENTDQSLLVDSTLCPKNVDHQPMAIILSKPNRFSKFFHSCKEVNCKQNPYNMSHHSQSMLPHHLWKIKVQIYDKLQMSCLMKQSISCDTVRQTMLLSTLQQLLEMSAFCPQTHLKMLTPLVSCTVNDALVHEVPNVQQTLLQFVNAVQL